MQDIALVIFAFVLSWSISVLFHCKASSALNTYNVAKRGMSKCQLFKHVHLEHVRPYNYYYLLFINGTRFATSSPGSRGYVIRSPAAFDRRLVYLENTLPMDPSSQSFEDTLSPH